ncbi:MAG: IPT/TIG domain-containing protein, partial [bacterium]
MKINTKNTILGTIFAGLLLFSGSNVFAAATPDIPAIITPAVITNSATSITTTSAILNGTVNPNGASTTAWFEDNNGNTFGLINVGSGNNAVTMLPYHWTGLTPNTNYIFRAVAQNVNGTATGSWGHFTTNQNPNNSTTPTLNSISPANATLGQTLSVTLDGTGFIANSTVVFSASGIVVNSTTINSTTSITVNISINSNASVGSNNVVVNNNNGTSNIQTFTIINSGGGGGGALVPSISSISPSSVLVGSGATTINIYGSNFTNNSLIYFNNSTRSVNFVNSGQITMYLNYSDTSSVGSWNIYVANNSGNNSNYITFTVYS